MARAHGRMSITLPKTIVPLPKFYENINSGTALGWQAQPAAKNINLGSDARCSELMVEDRGI